MRRDSIVVYGTALLLVPALESMRIIVALVLIVLLQHEPSLHAASRALEDGVETLRRLVASFTGMRPSTSPVATESSEVVVPTDSSGTTATTSDMPTEARRTCERANRLARRLESELFRTYHQNAGA